ncbi:hypothetical protein J6590_015098, partial [Homalodisca vitripennis]
MKTISRALTIQPPRTITSGSVNMLMHELWCDVTQYWVTSWTSPSPSHDFILQLS